MESEPFSPEVLAELGRMGSGRRAEAEGALRTMPAWLREQWVRASDYGKALKETYWESGLKENGK